MRVADAAAIASVGEAALVERAGTAVAQAALRMLGGGYGRRVVVVAGPGNNGADGRTAARILERWGAAGSVLEAAGVRAGERITAVDLVVDAAYGTGLRRPYAPPDPGAAPVLAVDIPSGLAGLTGRPPAGSGGAPEGAGGQGAGVGAGGEDGAAWAVRAARTVTFAAYKFGLLLGDGPDHTGVVEVADIGLGGLVDQVVSAWLVTDED